VKLIGNGNVLANGAYSATLLFQSDKTMPQIINVPLTGAQPIGHPRFLG
jgi:hypothetical protein